MDSYSDSTGHFFYSYILQKAFGKAYLLSRGSCPWNQTAFQGWTTVFAQCYVHTIVGVTSTLFVSALSSISHVLKCSRIIFFKYIEVNMSEEEIFMLANIDEHKT